MSKARDLADSAQEINILDGKSFLDEDNLASDSATGIASQQSIKAYVDGITTTNITSTGALNSGSITSGFGNIDNGSSTITTTGAITGGSFVIGSADINENDLESIDGITAGTVSASKAVVVNTNKDITGFRNITATGTISGSLSGTLSGSLSSTTTATTQAESDDSTKIATTEYVSNKITTLIGGAPSTLNDLNELAAAINDDANYNSTLTTALATKLPLAGGTMTGDVLYNDNIKAKFGAGSDLQIYSDGTNGYIEEAGGGNLRIITNGPSVAINKGIVGGENMALFNADGAVELFYNGSQKLATTSTGIDVTGTAVVDGLTTDSISNSSGNLSVSTTQSFGLTFDSNNDQTNREFNLMHDNGVKIITADENGDIKFYEDTGSTAKFFWDASAESLGIGTSSPNATLTVSKSGNNIFAVERTGVSSGSGQFGINIESSSQATVSYDDGARLVFGTASSPSTQAGFTERMRIDSSGNLIIGKDSESSNTAGHFLSESGYLRSTRNGSVQVLNRITTDGDIISLQKDGSTRGRVGVNNGDPFIARASGSGMRWYNGAVVPTNEMGNDSNNTMDLGSSGVRFKHGYFSGNLYGDGSNLTGISSGGVTLLGSVASTASATSLTLSNLDLTSYKYLWIVSNWLTLSSSAYICLQSNANGYYAVANAINGGQSDVGTNFTVMCHLASGVSYASASRGNKRYQGTWQNSGTTNIEYQGGTQITGVTNSTTSVSLVARSGRTFAYNNGNISGTERKMYLYGVA